MITPEMLHEHLRSPLFPRESEFWKQWTCRCGAPEYAVHEEGCYPTMPWFKYVLGDSLRPFLEEQSWPTPVYISEEHYTVELFKHRKELILDPRQEVHDHAPICRTWAPNYDILCCLEAGHEIPHLGLTGQLAHRVQEFCVWARVHLPQE